MIVPFTNTRLRLHPEWKHISTRASSMWLAYSSAIYSGVDAALSYAIEGRIGTTIVVFGISVAIAVARITHQESVSGPLTREGEAQ